MRKIFIDGGANVGQSTRSFLKQWPDSKEYEIFMFEPNSKPPTIYGNKTTLIRKAMWIYDGQIQFYEKSNSSQGNTMLVEKTNLENRNYKPRAVECISLSRWIVTNFTKKDYIILKLDIEGAEYEVMKDLEENKVFKFIDIFFCEIHGLKCGKTFEQSIELIDICRNNNLTPHRWDGDAFKFKNYQKKYYSEEYMKNEFKKWNKRGLS